MPTARRRRAASSARSGRYRTDWSRACPRESGELRLAGISTIAAANAWLPEDYNKRFGRAPANAKDLHRALTQADDLEEIPAWREARTVTRNLTLRYDRMMLLPDPDADDLQTTSRRPVCRRRDVRHAMPPRM